MRAVWLLAKTVLVEAVRRREIYAIVLVSVLLIGAVMTVDFFQLRGLSKFYTEVALQVMSIATALTTIVLAARQLPREFENRTIYPLLAKPITRFQFLIGKICGVMLATAFCLALFMSVFIAGILYLGTKPFWGLWAQYVYLQMIQMLILATLGFWFSLIMHLDAAVTLATVFYATSSVIMTATSYIYDLVGKVGKATLVFLTYVLPQLTLFDLSAKAVHGEAWQPLHLSIILKLTIYGLVFAGIYFLFAMICFRRRPL